MQNFLKLKKHKICKIIKNETILKNKNKKINFSENLPSPKNNTNKNN